MAAESQSRLGEEEVHGIASEFELAAAAARQMPSSLLSRHSQWA